MDLKRLHDRAKDLVEKRGGADSVKEDAGELRDVAKGEGSLKDKAKAAAEAIKEPPGAAPEKPAGEPTKTSGPGASVRRLAPERARSSTPGRTRTCDLLVRRPPTLTTPDDSGRQFALVHTVPGRFLFRSRTVEHGRGYVWAAIGLSHGPPGTGAR